jgi:lipid-A-disaccharide synthase
LQFEEIKNVIAPDLSIDLIDGNSRKLMEASDILLMASGTAVLEGMLVGRPMVAAYKLAPLTATIIKRFNMLKVKYVTLPNNLANEMLVPELIQEDATAENMVEQLEKLLEQKDDNLYQQQRFLEIHQQLKQNASRKAAEAICSYFLE